MKQSLPKEIFSIAWNPLLIAQYVRVYLANQRRNVSLGKNRAHVQGSTRKIYKQKGTGRARHGDIKAPVFVGGGLAHGPQNQSRALKMPAAMRRKALFVALSQVAREKHVYVILDEELMSAKKTKNAQEVIGKALGTASKKAALLVMPHQSESKHVYQNLTQAIVVEVSGLNAYNVLNQGKLIITPTGLEELEKQFTAKKS